MMMQRLPFILGKAECAADTPRVAAVAVVHDILVGTRERDNVGAILAAPDRAASVS